MRDSSEDDSDCFNMDLYFNFNMNTRREFNQGNLFENNLLDFPTNFEYFPSFPRLNNDLPHSSMIPYPKHLELNQPHTNQNTLSSELSNFIVERYNNNNNNQIIPNLNQVPEPEINSPNNNGEMNPNNGNNINGFNDSSNPKKTNIRFIVTRLGRKTKGYKGYSKHTKKDDDDKMSKIKSFNNRFLVEKLNSSLSPGHKKFLKINKGVAQNLTKQYNIELMQTTIKEILSNNTITDNYSRSENVKDYNKQLVEEIYLEGEETEAIKILEMNYKEFVDIIRTKHLREFEKDILNKEIKRGESKEVAREYIKELVDLLKRFEDYFEKKRDTKLRKQTNIKGDI